MRRLRRPLLLAVLLVFGLLPGPTGFAPPAPDPADPNSLAPALDRILDAPGARSAFWGVHVKNLTTGEVLYDRNGDKRLMPASNQKLFTTATALDALGSAYRYQTVLYFRGDVEADGTLTGDLVIRGSGDPTFGDPRFGASPLRTWARTLAEAGVTGFRGRIIGDDNVFDDVPFPEGWDVHLAGNRSYATGTSGLSYRNNIIDLVVRGGRSGTAPIVQVRPTVMFSVQNQARTAGRGAAIRVRQDPGALTIAGSIGPGQAQRVRLPVPNPTLFTAASFEDELRSAGLEVEAELVDVDELGRYAYNGAQPLLAHLSPTMRQIVRLINKTSNNFFAEHVFRTFSRNGTADGGTERVEALLLRAGVPGRSVSVRDGSGLSRKDMVTPQSVVQLLSYMYQHPEWKEFTRSLPTGGERGSTLGRRLHGIPVQAKTGSIEFSRALSGYVSTRSEDVLAFSIIANNYATSSGRITGTIDAVVRTLAQYRG